MSKTDLGVVPVLQAEWAAHSCRYQYLEISVAFQMIKLASRKHI